MGIQPQSSGFGTQPFQFQTQFQPPMMNLPTTGSFVAFPQYVFFFISFETNSFQNLNEFEFFFAILVWGGGILISDDFIFIIFFHGNFYYCSFLYERELLSNMCLPMGVWCVEVPS